MRNPFKSSAAAPAPAPPAAADPPAAPPEKLSPQFYLAVSNLNWQGLPPAIGRPADEQVFQTKEAAIAWLKSLQCGGSVSDGDRIVEEVLPGA